MDKKKYEILKAKFLKTFANVAIPLREDIVAMVEDKPISWNAAYGEIMTDSKNAAAILNHLKKMEII